MRQNNVQSEACLDTKDAIEATKQVKLRSTTPENLLQIVIGCPSLPQKLLRPHFELTLIYVTNKKHETNAYISIGRKKRQGKH